MHVHVSAVDFLVFLGFYLILRLFVTLITTKYPDSAVGKALAVLG